MPKGTRNALLFFGALVLLGFLLRIDAVIAWFRLVIEMMLGS